MKKTQLLITISILILSATLLAFSQSSASGNPLIFAGDKNFPPVEYLENSIPRGLNVELLNELSRILGREIDIRLMQWEEAQQKVLDGEIDAITTMAITEKRKELFDFSDITLRYQYCLFVNSQQVGIRTVSDLEGRAVGITEGGLPQQVLESNPKIKLVIVKDYAEGFRLLLSQEIDAVGADRWVGAYTLLENDIRGVTIIEEPIAEKVSGIAVKKGNTELLNEINLALSKLKTEGTIKTIEEKWATKEVLLLTRGQIRTSIIYGGAVLLILVVGGASLWISSLRKQIRLREKTSRELDKKTRELNAILSSVQDYLYIFDPEGRFVFANRKLLELWGISAGQATGRTMRDLGYPVAVETALLDGVRRVVKTGQIVRNVTHYTAPSGADGYYENILAPMPGPDGLVVFVAGTSRDITDRRRMEQDLRKSRDELELRVQERTADLESAMKKLRESNQALQDFASIASHDLQEPLRKVRTFADMLKQRCGDALGERESSYLERVIDANQRMQSLLTALLEYSRLTTRADPFTEVDLTKVIQGVLADLEVRIQRTGGEVRVGDLPAVKADPTQMRQLFQNLIGNALKFHKSGEKPLVRVFCSQSDNGGCRIVIEDNGIGFEDQYVEKIFGPFQRLHGKSSRYEGTGMGLAICKKIVERHGGSITAISAPGMGSSFIIQFPVSEM